MYDVTNRASLEHARKWLTQLKTHAHPSIVLCLLGNKCDLVERRSISAEEGQAFADENGLLFFEVSAKEATNVNRAFERMIVGTRRGQKGKIEDNMHYVLSMYWVCIMY